MSEPFLAEIRLMSFTFAPKGWAACDGQLLPINQNQALFALLGTTYGGDGRVNFALPDLRDRVPMHAGHGHTMGERDGSATVLLTEAQMPPHAHGLRARSADGTAPVPNGGVLARSAPANPYAAPSDPPVVLDPLTVRSEGGAVAHENRQPSLVVTYCIALQGIFPSPN